MSTFGGFTVLNPPNADIATVACLNKLIVKIYIFNDVPP
jgi:hypothetical protein